MDIRAQAAQRAEKLVKLAGGELTSAVLGVLPALTLASDFAFERLRVRPHWIAELVQSERSALHDTLLASAQLSEFRVLRSLQQIALECGGLISVADSLQFASHTANWCIEAALDIAERETAARFGQIRSASGNVQRLVVFAMGKLGGGELNYSSDIDLIMSYAENAESDGARSLDASEYYARIARRTAQLLSEPGELGPPYRVDLRLRPFGTAGQAALSFAAMEDYYQREGRDWERYAWIKAQPVAGDLAGGMQLKERLRPFVFRKYLDFAAFEGMREMKALVDAEVRKTERYSHLKLGPGGIREIEFLLQLEQLIRGGRDASLRTSSSLGAIDALARAGFVSAAQAQALRDDYLFLRAVENRVQMLGDQQTHTLPDSPELRLRVAFSLGFSDFDSFAQALQTVRDSVHTRFGESINLPLNNALRASGAETSADAFTPPARELDEAALMWENLTGPNADEAVRPSGVSPTLWDALRGFAESAGVQNASARGKQRLNSVVPLLWSLIGKCVSDPDPERQAAAIDACAMRLMHFLQAIVGRTAYLALLAEKPQVAERLVKLFASSAWLAAKITSTPILLDELLDQRRMLAANDAQSLAAEAETELREFAHEDVEAQFEALIAFQHSVQLRIAVGFLQGQLCAHQAVQALSLLADVVLKQVFRWCFQELSEQHGLPAGAHGLEDCGMIMIAYGSLGGKELNFSSDLDLVFLYSERAAQQETQADGAQLSAAQNTATQVFRAAHGETQVFRAADGETQVFRAADDETSRAVKVIDGQRFYMKLAQRMISRLTTATRFGALYAIDMRLRPNGNKGLLVTGFDAFCNYQQEEAWLWEHQALVRARTLGPDLPLASAFAAARQSVLQLERNPEEVRTQVAAMRERMRTELDRSSAEHFDLKQGIGGLVDIEFELQAQVLSAAKAAPPSTETRTLLSHFCRTAELNRHAQLLDLSLRATLALQTRVVSRHTLDAAP